jgi:predicted DCC family thiol-disulfide oxidoreductase YuxK
MLKHRALLHLIHRRIDPRPLAVARIMIASAALFRAAEASRILSNVLAPERLQLPYVSWLPELHGAGITALLGIWVAAAVALLIGWRTRSAGLILAAAMGYVLLFDEQTYSNHLYLLTLLTLLLAWADAGAAYSLDAKRTGPRRVPAGPVHLLRAQLSIVYGFSAIAKVNLVYISGAVISLNLEREGWFAVPAALHTPAFLVWVALATILGEAVIAVAVWSERWRPRAFVGGLVLHIGIVLLMARADRFQLAIFALEMFALYVLFIDPRERVRLVVWDDQCSFCRAWITWFRRLDWLRLHRFVGASEPAAYLDAGIRPEEADHALQLIGPKGEAAGFEAVRMILEALPVSFLWAPLLRLPPVQLAGDRAYRAVARRRRCLWAPNGRERPVDASSEW